MYETLTLLVALAALTLTIINAIRLAAVADHQRHHCGIGADLEDLLVVLDDVGITLPEHLYEAAAYARAHAAAYDGEGEPTP